MKSLGAVLLLALVPTTAANPIVVEPPVLEARDDAATLLEELKKTMDGAEPSQVMELAELRSEEALAGLLELYDVMQSIYMRRAVLQGLVIYDQVAGLEQRALQGIMDAATTSRELELRLIATDLLARCSNFGKAFLRMIVDSDADDEVRERAFQLHTASPRAEDLDWYGELYDPEPKEKKKKKKGDEEKERNRPTKLREIAFEALVGNMDDADVLKATEDKFWKIRKRALQELNSRSHKDAYAVAERLFEDGRERPSMRVEAAQILLDLKGTDAIGILSEAMGKIQDGEHELGIGLARMLAEQTDEKVLKGLVKDCGKGKGLRKAMSFHAARKLEDEKVDKALLKGLKDKDPRVVEAAIAILAERKHEPALEEFQKMIDKDKSGELTPKLVDAMAEIRRGDLEWERKLVELAASEDPDVRNNAITELGRTKNPDYLAVLTGALSHHLWSTRLAAARALEEMHVEAGVGAIAKRIQEEDGRLLAEFADILFRLTGQPFDDRGKLWARWWDDEGADFKIPSESEISKREREVEERRLRQISKSTFFGLRIESKRVIFIIDVSGSMREPTRGEYVGESGEPRMEVAKRELVKCLDGLETDSLFNMITFSTGVTAWQDTVSELTTATLEEAKGFVDRLGADGGTNLYGALTLAFEDPDVDTIFVLSDGEPTMGDVTDPYTIREDVLSWNENRGVKISCIAVGGSLQVLEWLASDNEGTYVKIP